MRRKPRLDATHKPIAKALTKLGASVCSLAGYGGGVPDLLIGYVTKAGPKAVLAEVKTESGVLTPDQVRWRCWWTGPFVIFRSVDDAVEWFSQERKKYERAGDR